ETRIVCAVDLDAPGPIRIETGVGFFDHMLEQIAAHGGFSLRLQCEGDLHTDPHHTIEDSAIALGQALKQALGERKGIARYGFVLPMDEANATVSIDLSGRPYPLFEGTFDTPFIGDYRTDLTAHVFRSLAEAMGAAVHIKVTGQDDHHKTEAVYKAFGRALRQAIRVEGDAVPSTKGVL
ncbi:MAG: imidazoleglycerol-phosphate dehydratase HisB, partial [Alphaproteobacteria bacterium]|nr:imidazoleglycerol-phosphate dehydratase HisB [Alphaproteobacteria bacterium]